VANSLRLNLVHTMQAPVDQARQDARDSGQQEAGTDGKPRLELVS
jgi:hypothetical protein